MNIQYTFLEQLVDIIPRYTIKDTLVVLHYTILSFNNIITIQTSDDILYPTNNSLVHYSIGHANSHISKVGNLLYRSSRSRTHQMYVTVKYVWQHS